MDAEDVRAFLDSILDEDIHTKRVDSLANATLGVMTGASLGVAMIGKSLAQARGLLTKHAAGQSHMKNPVAGSTQRNPCYEQRNVPTRVTLRSGTLDPS